MARGQVYFDGSHRGKSVNVAPDQNSVVLGGFDKEGSPVPGMGPHSIGAKLKGKSLADPFGGADHSPGGKALPAAAKRIDGQLPKRGAEGNDGV